MAGSRFLLTSYGPSATAALAALVTQLKTGDPLTPITVTPPSVHAGLSLRRRLARDGGIVNTRFMPLPRVAELLAAEALGAAGLRPLGGAIRRQAIRAVLADEPGVFAEVATSASTIDALDAAFRELRPLDDGERSAVSRASGRASELVRLFDAWRAQVAGFYDETDLMAGAIEALSSGSASLRDLGTVIAHLPDRLTPGELRFAEALAGVDRLGVVVGLTGDPALDAPARGLVDRLARHLGPPSESAVEPARMQATRLVVAATPEEEVRVAVRDLAGLARSGIPPRRVALVSYSSEPYATVARDVLAEAGLEGHGPAGHTLAGSTAGRVLLGALALRDGRFARHEVMAWLQCGPILAGREGSPCPAPRWDLRSRQAGVTVGVDQWRRRLDGLARNYDQRAAPSDEVDERQAARLTASSEAAELARFMDELVSRLAPPRAAGWAEWSAWATGLLSRYLGGEAAHAEWPDPEIEALRSVESAVESLALLDAVSPGPDLDGFRRAVTDALDAAGPRTTRFGQGVFVGRVADLIGTDFDAVYVLGVAEGSFPPRLPVGLLGDLERAAAPALAGDDERRLDARRITLAALASAPHVVMLTPATDPRAGRSRQPAPWFLEAASDRLGAPVFAQTLDTIDDQPWFERYHSSEDALRRAPEPASPVERALAELLAARDAGDDPAASPPVGRLPTLGRGLATVSARIHDAGGPWQGFVGALPTDAAELVLSPTALETWSVCPFQYFLGHLLGLRALDDPEEIDTLRSDHRGRLVHDILESFIEEFRESMTPDTPWTGDHQRRLDEIIDDRFAAYEDMGRTGSALLWEFEQRRIRRLLHRFLAVDTEVRAELGVTPVLTEFGFAEGDAGTLDVELGGDRRVRLRGFVDRIDRSPDGTRLRVVDYKTGRPIATSLRGDPFEGDRFVAGTRLQLAAYALAARREFGDVPTRAEYWYVSERWRFKREGYDVTDEVVAEFVQILSGIASGIAGGVFPANPGADTYRPGAGFTYDHCHTCDFERVCPVDRAEAWERKADAPELEAYRSLGRPS